MDKKKINKEIKTLSILNGRANYSKYSKDNSNNSKTKICERKDKSELKLQTNYEKFFPLLIINTYNSQPKFKNENNRKKNCTITMVFRNPKSPEELHKTLSFNKNRMLKNKTELNELKNQYNILSEYNENNRKILSKILNLKNNNQYSKEEILEKLKNCDFDKSSKKKMLDSINFINLKLEVNEKKSILRTKNNEFDFLKENIKYKNISELNKNLLNKKEIKKHILLDIEKLKEVVLKGKQDIKLSEEENTKLEEKYKEFKREEEEILGFSRKI